MRVVRALRSSRRPPRTAIRAGAGQPMRGRGQGEGAAAGEASGDDGGKATVLLFSRSPPAATGSSPSIRVTRGMCQLTTGSALALAALARGVAVMSGVVAVA